MITNNTCNHVCFSDLLRTNTQYADAWKRIESILKNHQISYDLLPYTKDIWCRDYMPIQLDSDNLIQFRYEPSYLRNDPHLRTDPNEITRNLGLKLHHSNINLDGGNVVNYQNQVLITERVFKENSSQSKTEIIKQLEAVLMCSVNTIPDITTDLTGHADGHLRFIDKNTVLVNRLDQEYKYWRNGFLKMIKLKGLHYLEMPWFEDRNRKNSHSAIGCYMNFLEVGNLIVFPVFEVQGNKDEEALKTIESVFPDRHIEPININAIGEQGGLMNCISWTLCK